MGNRTRRNDDKAPLLPQHWGMTGAGGNGSWRCSWTACLAQCYKLLHWCSHGCSNVRNWNGIGSGQMTSQDDAWRYRNRYPSKGDNPDLNDNYHFYANEIPCRPDGALINDIHKSWWGQYDKLEHLHGYIQWLFPIREQGVNDEAQELQLHEAKRIGSDPVMRERVLKSYELMLDFYGMKLKYRNTGEIERADNWKERFHHLNHSSHNYLRITRILKCLGEMEYEYLKAPFLRFVLHEAIVEGTLDHTLDSCINYWLEVLRDDQERADVKAYMKSSCVSTPTSPVYFPCVHPYLICVHPYLTCAHPYLTCVHPYLTCVHPYLTCAHPYLTCVHPYLTCVHPYLTCVHPYLTCVHPYLTCAHPYLTCAHPYLTCAHPYLTCIHPYLTCTHPYLTCTHPYLTCAHPYLTCAHLYLNRTY
ncbi:hypothetical protein EMCRGX_G023653 [Ephydatia muelleri]